MDLPNEKPKHLESCNSKYSKLQNWGPNDASNKKLQEKKNSGPEDLNFYSWLTKQKHS